jgi:hypothetical protein
MTTLKNLKTSKTLDLGVSLQGFRPDDRRSRSE